MQWLACLWFALVAISGPAYASDPEVGPPESALVGRTPDGTSKDKVEVKTPEEKEKQLSDAEKAAEQKRKDKLARVIVLKWQGTDTDYADSDVQRIVKSRIQRPDAGFFPDVDLYQEGRKVKDETVVPAMQPAIVPSQNIDRVMAEVEEVSAVPYNAWAPADWGLKAGQLAEMVELLWFVDRVELREPLFLLYAQIGRAAENQNEVIPPFYEQIGFQAVNYYYYLAAMLAYQDPSLMSKLTDQDLNASIQQYLTMMQQGAFTTMKINFELEGVDFDAEDFATKYEIYLNGLKTEPDDQGEIDIFLGRTDIYLKRVDNGHGLSERLEVSKLEGKRYFVRDVARKKMGLDLIEQLFLHLNECVPQLDSMILNYLAIYAKIHEKAEIYVAVPKEGNANKTSIWRYDRPTASLSKVQGGDDSFPVHFAVQLSGGIAWSSANVATSPPTTSDVAGQAQSGDFSVDPQNFVDIEAIPAFIPLTLELRAHYNRLMLGVGAEAGFNTGGNYNERYILPGDEDAVVYSDGDDSYDNPVYGDTFSVSDQETAKGEKPPTWGQATHSDSVNRDLYVTGGVVLGRDAGFGIGPRIALRVGWTNMPYALNTTAHFGWNFEIPMKKQLPRVRPYVDIDGRVGAIWPFRPSLAWEIAQDPKANPVPVSPIVGITAGIGTTL
ncbi:hypothetical protein LBMAG42_34090 [Deltaproteobacteria bacterium]|nr:hypothetical protein LBMAG42_34090 [Deltaproteobacteria bacterium]